MKDKRITVLLIICIIIAIGVLYLAIKSSSRGFIREGERPDFDIHKKLSDEYLNYGLYEQAVQAYEKYFLNPGLSDEKKSNISYIIANIYMDNLSDYRNAMANFVKAKALFPSNPNISDINTKMVACLERMGNSLDAERELSKATNIKKDKTPEVQRREAQGVIVAKIGDRSITMAEIDSEIEKLPPFLKGEYNTIEKKKEFLQQYLTGELLYDSAKRRNFDNDKDIIDGSYRAKKQMMIEKLYREEVESKVEGPSDSDIKLYYDANKDKYTEEKKDDAGNVTKRQKEFDEVKDMVKAEYTFQKRQEKMSDFVNGLMKAKEVKIYEDVLK